MKQFIKFLVCTLTLFFAMTAIVNAQTLSEVFHSPSDPVAGNPNGKVTVVEFFDYQCSHCINMAPTIAAIIKANPQVRIVFKEFPIRGPMSDFASRAALAANKQGKYYVFNHALLTSSEPLNEDTIFDIAKKVGLNVTKLKKDMSSRAIYNQLSNTRQLANSLKLSGTPAFIIGRTDARDDKNLIYVLGEMSQSDLQSAIDKTAKN